MSDLTESPKPNGTGHLADHAALKATLDGSGATPLPQFTAASTAAEHRAIHARLHAVHNTRSGATALPTTLGVGAAGHLSHHATLHREANARSTQAGLVYRGVNLSGAEFAPDAAHLPGQHGTDYTYPTRADLAHLAGRGHRMVRLPIRWERIQPVLLAALSAPELTRLLDTVDLAHAVGVDVLVDVHNYARYIRPATSGGATLVLGDGTLTTAHLVDLWRRLSTALKGRPGVLGYGLMNEPHDLPAETASLQGAVEVNGFTRSAESWSGEGDAVASLSTAPGTYRLAPGALQITRDLVPAAPHLRANDSGSLGLAASNGTSLAAWVLVPGDAPGNAWNAHLEMQDANYRWTPGPTFSLAPGQWTQLRYTPAEAVWSGHRAIGVQFATGLATPATATGFLDTVQQGFDSPSISPARQWEQVAQACVTAVRENGDTTMIFVPGYDYQSAKNWPGNHPRPWVQDPAGRITYEAHYYFDRDNSGTYQQSYAAESDNALSRGYPSLPGRAVTELSRFLDWCTTHAVRGFVGELGWENTRDVARWNAVGAELYAALDAAHVGAACWAAGGWYGNGYNLSVYRGTPLASSTPVAGVVEAHPSFLSP